MGLAVQEIKMDKEKTKNIIVICTGNSCRSQMAEGFLQYYTNNNYAIYSAGIIAAGVNSKAIEVMKEIGIDISNHTSNLVDEYSEITFDYIITVCDNARAHCPYIKGYGIRYHHNFPDPCFAIGTPKQVLKKFRKVREMIKSYVIDFVKNELN